MMVCTCNSGRATHCGFEKGERLRHEFHLCPFDLIARRLERKCVHTCECCPLCTLICLPRKVLLRLPEYAEAYKVLKELGE